MSLVKQVKQSVQQTGTIQIRHPHRAGFKTIHRKPKFRKDGIYVQIERGLYKIVDFKKRDILAVYEVE